MRTWHHAIPMLLLLPLLAGCVSGAKKSNALDSTLFHYQSAMRWGHWDTLKSYRHKEAPALPELDLENVRVTSYEVRVAPLPVDEKSVSQTVEIQYVLKDQQMLRKVRDQQLWRYDEEAKQWWLYSPFPELR